PIALNSGQSDNQYFTLRKKDTDQQNAQLTSEYIIDASVDSLTFIMNGTEEDEGFEYHNLRLISPTGQIIDSVYAQNDPDIEFSQDIENRIAYYFVRHPQPGIWQLTHSDSVAGAYVSAPIATDFNVSVNFLDSLYVVGQSVQLEIPLPQPINYTDVQIVGNVYRVINGTDTLMLLGNIPLTLSPDGLSYVGQYTPALAGTYYLGINFSCNRAGVSIVRNLLEPFNVFTIAPPQLVHPPDNQNVTVDSVHLSWRSSLSANMYRLQVFVLADTLPVLDLSGISDTTFSIVLPINEERYIWRVQAINVTDTSAWSEIWSFTRRTPISSIAVDLSGGWNMISNPVTSAVNTDTVKLLFPNSIYPYAFRFLPGTGYQQDSTLENGAGFWAKFPSAEINFVVGETLILDSIEVSAGWNMIGSISNPVDTSAV
ncbi:MAG: hypothetical protein Q8M94_07515, partial [Ignavibacteria bacterium]|nr:hypothetical protein [Ignavibacteria bacterium]